MQYNKKKWIENLTLFESAVAERLGSLMPIGLLENFRFSSFAAYVSFLVLTERNKVNYPPLWSVIDPMHAHPDNYDAVAKSFGSNSSPGFPLTLSCGCYCIPNLPLFILFLKREELLKLVLSDHLPHYTY